DRCRLKHRHEFFPRLRHARQHVVETAHSAVDARLLKGSDQAKPCDLGHAQARNFATVEPDRAVVDRMESGDRVEQRCLAGSVGTDQPRDASLSDAQADLPIGNDATEPLAHVVDFEKRAHWPAPLAGLASTRYPNRAGKRARAQPRMPTGKKTMMT